MIDLTKRPVLMFLFLSLGWLMASCSSTIKTVELDRKTDATILDTLQIVNNFLKESFPKENLYEFKAGDINQDKRFDIVVVTEKLCSDDEDSFCRTVFLLINFGEANFKLGATNKDLVDCSNCTGGDTYRGLSINEGIITFESLYGGCDKTNFFVSFQYKQSEKDWLLYEIKTIDYSCREKDHIDGEVPTYLKIKTTADFGEIKFEAFKN